MVTSSAPFPAIGVGRVPYRVHAPHAFPVPLGKHMTTCSRRASLTLCWSRDFVQLGAHGVLDFCGSDSWGNASRTADDDGILTGVLTLSLGREFVRATALSAENGRF